MRSTLRAIAIERLVCAPAAQGSPQLILCLVRPMKALLVVIPMVALACAADAAPFTFAGVFIDSSRQRPVSHGRVEVRQIVSHGLFQLPGSALLGHGVIDSRGHFSVHAEGKAPLEVFCWSPTGRIAGVKRIDRLPPPPQLIVQGADLGPPPRVKPPPPRRHASPPKA